MIRDNPDKLTEYQGTQTKTNFNKPKRIFNTGWNKTEKLALDFFEKNKIDVGVFNSTRTSDFLINWLEKLISHYTECALYAKEREGTIEYKGIVMGQREILYMLKYLRNAREKVTKGGKR